MSQFTVNTYYSADSWCLFKQAWRVIYHWNQYDEAIYKKCRPVCRPSICNANKKSNSFIINSRMIISMLGEMAWHPVQENEVVFSKNVQKFKTEF